MSTLNEWQQYYKNPVVSGNYSTNLLKLQKQIKLEKLTTIKDKILCINTYRRYHGYN